MREVYAGRQIVGIDLHRRRSVLVRMTEAGQTLETIRISNDPEYLRQVMVRAGESPEVVLEACYGWYWAADTLVKLGANVHLAHPLGVKGFTYRRVKMMSVMLRTWLISCGWVAYLRPGSPRRPVGSCVSWSGTGPRCRTAVEFEVPGACGAGRCRSAGRGDGSVRWARCRWAGAVGPGGVGE